MAKYNQLMFHYGYLQKKMTIKLMRDPKKQIKNEVKTDVKVHAGWVNYV